MELAPICLFVYNRPEETRETVKALQDNYLAARSNLYIFSDGPKNLEDNTKVCNVRNYIRSISDFKKVEIFESQINNGLANSIIKGVTQVIEKYGKVIVLEDDLITTPNFLNFMNQALAFYAGNKKIYSISGYTMDLPSLKTTTKDFYFCQRASSWGWATWEDQWQNVDWEIKNYLSFKFNPYKQYKFFRIGTDLPRMLRKQISGKIDSWAIRWCYWQFQHDLLTIYPTISKVVNIGFGENSTNTKYKNYFRVTKDEGIKQAFKFEYFGSFDKKIVKEFRHSFSIQRRIKNKLYLYWFNYIK